MQSKKIHFNSEELLKLAKPETLSDLDNMSKRLKYVVDTLGVKQSHLAEKLGVSPSGLHYILNNDARYSKNAKKIAEYLKVNEQWLSTGQGNIFEENKSIKTYKIPLYYPDQLKLYYRSEKRNIIETNNFILTTTFYKNNVIGIYVTETDFSPKFEVGDKITFEQNSEFRDGEILLVYLAQSNDILIKYGFQTNNEIFLISPVTGPIKFFAEKGDFIIGVYRECLKQSM